MAKENPLNLRERRFVEAFMGNGGNATKAAEIAGFSKRSAAVLGHRLLRKVKIAHAIEAAVKANPVILDKPKLQEFWSAIADGRGAHVLLKMRDRLKASELLGRSQAAFTDNVNLNFDPLQYLAREGKDRVDPDTVKR